MAAIVGMSNLRLEPTQRTYRAIVLRRARLIRSVMRHRQDVVAAESIAALSPAWLEAMVCGRPLARGDVDADSIRSQRALPARAAWRRNGCRGAGPTRA